MPVVYQDQAVQLIQGDVLAVLKTLPDNYVQTVVSSPPYWGLRDYKIPPQVWDGVPACKHRWRSKAVTVDQSANVRWQHTEGGGGDGTMNRFAKEDKKADGDRVFAKVETGSCAKCGAWRGSLGLELTPELYVQHLVDVFREVRRVLKLDGTLWLNLGDSYASGFTGRNDTDRETPGGRGGSFRGGERGKLDIESGLKPKDLVGIPWRVAFALQADGWWLRSDIIWNKSNPMPESVQDRPTRAHEYIFLLTKSAKYYYNTEAIKEPAIYAEEARYDPGTNGLGGGDRKTGKTTRRFAKPAGWSAEDGAHNSLDGRYKALPEGQANIRDARDKQRGHGRRHDGFNDRWDLMTKTEQCSNLRNKRSVWTVAPAPFAEAHFATFPEALIEPCILAGAPIGGLVLDPFSGAATTLLVAKKLNRKAIGIELSEAYCAMSAKRLQLEPARLL